MSSLDISGMSPARLTSNRPGNGLFGYFTDPERRIVLKLDAFLLVYAFIAGLTKDMDQSATTQAYVSGMKETLELNGNELVEFTTYFSIGYALCIVPAQLIQTRVRPSIFLPICEILWGFLKLTTYACKNAKSVYALRVSLGMFESTSWPGLVNLIFNWYTQGELAKRLAIFGVSSVAGSMFLGILQAHFTGILTEFMGSSGIITIVWGFIGLLVIPDSPANTRALWLTESERELARLRMSRQGTTVQEKISGKQLQKKLAFMFRSPVTYLFIISYLQFAWSQRANSWLLLFLKGLKSTDGTPLYSTYKVNIIPLGGYSISIVCNVGLNAISDWKRWRWQVSIFAAGIQVIAVGVLAGYSITAWMAEILRKEPEARAVLIGLTVTLVYIGHATIPLRAWRVSDSPTYKVGFPMATAFAAGGIITILAMYLWTKKNPELEEYGFVGEAMFLAEAARDKSTVDVKEDTSVNVINKDD
ncbi:related to transporter protein [Rhynchosporium agropyri]|uniref:Related to transporter protein n=1 Tax=Rhynchosporium agropyri TaxID=914238 RepID=A0A1E1K0V1_9HELO|nr:related to transporter protein [Rhynchosporium agropyri]